MTDQAPIQSETVSPFASEAALKRLKQRHNAERRFKLYGQLAIGIAISALFVLIFAITSLAMSAFSRHEVQFDLRLDANIILAGSDLVDTQSIEENVSGFNALIRQDLRETFPGVAQTALMRRDLYGMVTRLAVLPMARKTAKNPEIIGTEQSFSLAVSDDLDLYLKGGVTGRRTIDGGTPGRLGQNEAGYYVLSDASDDPFPAIREVLQADTSAPVPAILMRLDNTWFRLTEISGASVILTYLSGPLPEAGEKAGSDLSALVLSVPESDRTVSDRQVSMITTLEEQGRIDRRFNSDLFTKADSTYPEIAGAAAAIVGSFLTMLVTAFFAIPVGILAAVYLEEFAHKSRITDMIEVNINNLAAVPSIVFGLLGAAVFLNAFGMPRSVPLVGGLVLGLLVLPTVIIASRAALKSVPPSVRTAALGLGASKTQAIFHHVLPLAAPGIMTGSIIGMARALGETAPLLLIGMVAFVAEIPSGPGQESTVLPVLIYKWSTGAERAWEPMTAAAIVILLVFLIVMNLAAVLLRRRFERRW